MSKLSELKGVNIRTIAKVPDSTALIVDIHGPEHGGKSHFAASAAGKRGMFYQTLEPHASATTLAKFRDRDILVAEYVNEVPPEVSRAASEKVKEFFEKQMATFKTDMTKALKAAPGCTIVWDKAVNLWENIRYAHHGRLVKVPQHLYVQPNIEFSDLVTLPRKFGSTLIMLNEEKEEWQETQKADGTVTRGATGRMIPHAQKSTGYLADVRLRAWKVPPLRDSKGQAITTTVFKLTVTECRANPDMVGETLEGVTWQELCVMVRPEMDPETWL